MTNSKYNSGKIQAQIGIAVALLSFVFFAVVSCDVLKPGLGEKVDVTPPTLGIDALTPDKSIPYMRGNIVLGGAVADDRGLSAVAVQFTAADGTAISLPATVTNGRWTYAIPSGLLATDANYGHSLADGEQLISIVATDSSGKVTTTKQTIYVDNKPPTVLVTSPLGMGIADRPTVTDSLAIMGEVYDASPIVDVTVSVLKPDGSVLFTKKADGTSTWTVNFPLTDGLPISMGGKPLSVLTDTSYYYTVKVTDKAGNISGYYFHRSGIIAIKTPSATMPIMDDIGKLDQKGIAVAGITPALLQGQRLGVSLPPVLNSYGDVNYDASPKMNFSFYNITPGALAQDNALPENSVLVGVISPPISSGVKIDKNNIIAEFRDGNNPSWNSATPVWSYTTNPLPPPEVTVKTLGSNGDTVSFVFKLPVAHFPQGKYQVRISAGTDVDSSLKQMPSSEFFMIDSGVPTLTENTLDPSTLTSLYQNAPFQLTGTASDNTGISKIEIWEQKDGGTSNLVQAISGSLATSLNYTSNPLPISAPAAAGSFYSYKLVVTSKSGRAATLYRSTSYDNNPPQLSFSSVAPVIGTKTVNGNITATLSASDASGIDKVRLWIKPSAAAAPVWGNTSAPTGSTLNDGFLKEWTSGPYSLVVDTTAAYTPNADYKLWAIATDKAGNYSVAQSYDITIDQSTDLPVVTLTNMDVSKTTPAGAMSNLFGNGAKIQGTISDDDMVNASGTLISIDGGAGVALSSPGSNLRTVNFEHDISALSEGVHRFNLTAYDLASAKNGQPAVSTKLPASGDVYFMVDKNPPSLAITSPAVSGSFQKADFTISGTASDSNALDPTTAVQIKNGATVLYTIPAASIVSGNWSQLINTASLAEATQNWTIVSTDVAGKQTSLPFSFTFDKTPPVVNITSPVAASWNIGIMLTASGTVTDANSVSLVEFSKDSTNGVNGTWAATSGTVSWSADINLVTLGEGNKTLWVRATDAAGNTSAAVARAFGVDLNLPTLSETSIGTNSTVYRSGTYTLSGTTGDSNALASIVVTEKKDAGAPATVLSSVISGTSQTWTTPSLPSGGVVDGNYQYTITTTDIAGRIVSLTRNVIIDTTSPTVTITDPQSNHWYAGTSYLIDGTAADPGAGASGVALVEYSLVSNTGPWTSASGASNWNASISLNPEGLKTLYVRSTDAAGNHSTVQSVAFAGDQNPPVVTETTIGTSSTIKKAAFSFGGAASDTSALATVSPLTVSINAGPPIDIPVTSGSWTYSVTVDTAGHSNDATNSYLFTVTDIAGRTTTLTRTVTIDTTAPAITITNPTISSWLSGASSTANGTAADGGSGVTKIEYSLDNATWVPGTGTTNWSANLNLASIGEGNKTLYIRATDVAGNSSVNSVAFGIDQNPPAVTETAINTSSTVYKSAAFTLSGLNTDTNALASILVTEKKDAAAPTTLLSQALSGTSQTWNTSSLPSGGVVDGTYVYSITTTDVSGKTASLTRTVIVDTSPPTVTIVNPVAAQWYSGSAYTINGTSADVGASGVALVEYSLTSNTGPWTAAAGTTTWNANISLNPEGAKTLYVRSTDGAGNHSGVQSVAFGADQNPPVLTETTIGTATTTKKAAFSFGGSATDTNSLAALHALTVSINGGAAIDIPVSSGNWTYSVPVDVVGHTNDASNTYTFVVTDVAGHTTTVNRTALIDTTVPVLTITSPSASQWVATATPTISGVATDGTGSGVNKVYLTVDDVAVDHSADVYTTWTLATGTSNWSSSVSLTGEGQKKIWVKAVDSAGNVTTSATTLNFGYDSAPPTITETVNGASTQTYKANFSLGGAASDSNSLTSVTVAINGAPASAATFGSGNWSYNVPVDTATHTNDGNLAIVITATDAAGKTTTVNRSAVVDTKAPTITMINPDPAGTSWLGGTSYTIKGSADDGIGIGVAQVWIKVDAASVDHSADTYTTWTLATGTSSFTTAINPTGLGDGNKKIWVKAVDGIGNVTTTATTVLFGVDTINPALAFTGPVAGKAFNQAFNITGTASDANLANVSYTIDGGAATSFGAQTSWTIAMSTSAVAALSEGLHTVAVTAVDAAGNSVVNTLTFQRDAQAPTVTVNTLNANTGYTSIVVQDSTPVLSGTINDDIGLTGWNYRIEHWTDNNNLAGTTWTAGTTMTVVQDWNSTPFAVSGTSQAWSVDLNAVLGGAMGLPLPDGRYRILINAVDGSLPANSATTMVREFRLDRGVPSLVITTPASQGLYMGSDISTIGTATEANGIQAVALKFDSSDFSSGTIYTATLGGTPTAATWNATLPVAAVANGAHLVWVQATAQTGKTSLQSISLNIDKTPPTVAITSASNASRVTGQLVVAGTANDNTVLSKVQYRFGLNASTWYDMPNGALYSWSYTFADVSAYANSTYAREINPTTKADQPGSNIWLMPFEVRAIDQAGNVTNITTSTSESANRFYFMIDPLGDLPVTSIFSPSDGASLGGEINIYGNATDNTWVKSLSYQVSQDGTTWTDGVSAGSAGGTFSAATIVGNPGPTLSWSAKINSNGWMSPVTGTKTIYFRIHATDSKDFGATAGVNGTDTQISIVLNSSIPQIKNVQIDPDANPSNGNELAYSSGVKAAGIFYVRAEVYTPVGLSDLKRVEQGPLSGQTSILADSSVVTLPSLKTAGSFVTGRKYLISAVGSTDFTQIGGVNTVGKTFTATGAGSGSGTAYEAESAGLYSGFFKYLVGLQINSNTLGSNQFLNTSGVYAMNLQAVDLTTPAPFQTSVNLSVQIDNYYPTSNGMTSVTNITGTSFAVQGQVTDVGSGSGTVAGVAKVVAYFTRGSNIVNLHGGAASSGTTLPVKDFAAGGALQSVIYPPAETGNQNFSFNVSSYSETPGNDADTANGGNADGFEDKLTYNGSAVDWYAKFDTTQIADGPATLHYVIIDTAGNASHYTQAVFIANNPPTIVQITLGTDLNGDGTIGNVASGESVAYNPAQFANTGFTVRGSHVNLSISASGGNGTMYYSVKYSGTEKNSTLTSNSVDITNFTGISDSATANDRTFTVFVYDSTPGTTPGVDSLSTTKTISMTIKNTDTTVPTVTMVPLYWNSTSDNSLYGNSMANGHLNFGSMAAPLNDTNPKVSGQVRFNGTVSDDQRIQYVTMTIGNGTTGYDFAGGTSYGTSFVVAQWDTVSKTLKGVDNWATRGWKFVVTNESLTSAGHSANWELDWDSAKLNTVAGTGISVAITAQDYRNPGSLGSANLSTTASQTIDVVPYITSVTTLLSNLNTQNPSVFNRTALGRYPVNASETIKLNGFNLTGATITGISSGITITGGVVSVPMTSASSGNLPLLVNGVPLINNLDNNSLDYNKMPNGINNNLLTNDVALDVWQFNNRAAVPISGQIADPVMKINPVSGKMGFAFTNGPLYFSMGGTVGGTEYSYNYWQASYDFLTSVAFAYDSAGHTYGSAAGGDINSNSADKFSFMTDRWGKGQLDQNGSYSGTNALRLESIGQVNGGVNDFNKYRIKSPSYATSRIATSPNSTNVYLAYYDDMNTEIRFRYGNLLDTATTKTNFSNLAAVNAGSFVVGTSYIITTVGSTNFTAIGAASNTVGVNFVATGAGSGSGTATAEANFFDSDTAGAPGVYSTAYKSIVAGSTTGRNAGEFVSIGVIPGATVSTDVVVMVWYDATNQCLWYSYNTTPTINRSRTATAAGWSTPMQIFSNAGQYCQVAVDAGGGIHIAAYDIGNANLLYAHLTSYSDTSPRTSVVDSYGIVGTEITIDVAKVGSNYIPYIGYYAQSSIRPKYAYLVDTTSTYPDGAVNDAFTGAWEVTLLPTSSSVPNDNINVGVWKDATGALKNSVTGTSAYTKTGTGYTATNYGQCYGNGTSNGVLAYQIKESTNGYIETAQKK